MKSTCYSFFLFLLSLNVFPQEMATKRSSGFQINLQTMGMLVSNKDEIDTTPAEYAMLMSESQLFGANLEVGYRFDEYWIVGLGTGYETINKPSIDYVPVYLSLRSSIGGERIQAPIFRLNFGTHFGDLTKNGALLRIAMGYRIPVFQTRGLVFEGIFTYQGLRKEFESLPGEELKYNMVGIGVGIGLEL